MTRSTPDPIFSDVRLARVYDDLDGDRDDLDLYESIVAELGASSVLDVGCGTGTLACRLARRGVEVTGLDPAAASLDVARSKPGADAVTWLHAAADEAPNLGVDMVVMTGNVAQVFVADDEWTAALTAIRRAVADDGHVVFETRDPSYRAWEAWTREASVAVEATGAGPVERWVEVTSVALPLVSFRWTFRFLDTHVVVESDSTLRFRTVDELDASLAAAGFRIDEVRDAPDRPGREFVVIARPDPGPASTGSILSRDG